MLLPCGYRQRASPIRHLALPPIPSFWCHLKRCAVIENTHVWLDMRGCDRCQERNPDGKIELNDLVPSWLLCEKRGRPTGEEVACQCSIDRRLFKCSDARNATGKCLKRLPPSGRIESLGKIMDGVAVCAECQFCNTETES